MTDLHESGERSNFTAKRNSFAMSSILPVKCARFHNYDLDEVAEKIAEGFELLRRHPMDVLLIDPQYTPAMRWRPM